EYPSEPGGLLRPPDNPGRSFEGCGHRGPDERGVARRRRNLPGAGRSRRRAGIRHCKAGPFRGRLCRGDCARRAAYPRPTRRSGLQSARVRRGEMRVTELTRLPLPIETAASHPDRVLDLRKVCKQYGTDPAVIALADVDLVLRRGEWMSITGPSGAGKST